MVALVEAQPDKERKVGFTPPVWTARSRLRERHPSGLALGKADTVSPEFRRRREQREIHLELYVLQKRDSVFVSS